MGMCKLETNQPTNLGHVRPEDSFKISSTPVWNLRVLLYCFNGVNPGNRRIKRTVMDGLANCLAATFLSLHASLPCYQWIPMVCSPGSSWRFFRSGSWPLPVWSLQQCEQGGSGATCPCRGCVTRVACHFWSVSGFSHFSDRSRERSGSTRLGKISHLKSPCQRLYDFFSVGLGLRGDGRQRALPQNNTFCRWRPQVIELMSPSLNLLS